jgi:selenocysteine-specific elongation factor
VPKPLHAPLLESLIAQSKVAKHGSLLALADFRETKSREREEFEAKVLPLLLRGGTTPPRTREIVEATGIPLKPLERILQQCAREGAAVKVADNRYYLPQTLSQLAKQAEELAAKKHDMGFSVIEFRDATGMGRNLCIEVLEHFDACGYTQRRENVRVLRRKWTS